jgi:hypothetical protein
MPLTTYTAGEVLTAASLNANFTFAAGGGGLTFITGATFTAATSFSLPNDTFTTTYDNYKILISLTTSTDADFTMRLRAAGSDTTAAIYNTALAGVSSTNVNANSTGNSATSFTMVEQDAGLAGYSAILDVVNPKLATNTRIHGSINLIDKPATASVSRVGTFWINNTTAYDSLTFISSVAFSITGNYRVYGYLNS